MSDTMANGARTSPDHELMKPWVIDWRGTRLSSEEVTVSHYASVAMLAGDSWDLDPRKSPGNLIAWVCVAVCMATGRDMDEVRAEVGAAPMVELLNSVVTIEQE